MMIENEHFNCMKMVNCKVMIIDNQKGYRWHKGALGAPRGCRGVGIIRGLRGVGGVNGVLGAGRECRYSVARRV